MELKVLRMLDNNSNVITYGSESVVIPYTSPLDNRLHRYFVDMVAALKDKEGNIKKMVKFKNKLRKMRQAGLEREGEFSVENIVYKDLRNRNLLKTLEDRLNYLIDKRYSF